MAVRAVSAQWPLAGRDGELGAFEAVWSGRRCQGMVVAGPAGVGKTRLAEECLARAVRGGFKGRRATASAAAAAVPLGAVAHLVPPGVDLLDPVVGFAQVARALAGPGGDRRWAVLVDDLHLLDAASAVLLNQLMDSGVVRLIGTLRTGEPPREAVTTLCGGDAVARIDLDAFDRDRTAIVLQTALGGPVSRRAVHELLTASGGNALYLHELVRGALADGSLGFDGEIWGLAEGRTVGTPRLAELIAGRLASPGPAAQTVLDLLALCEPVPLADAEAAGHGPEPVIALEQAGLVMAATRRRRRVLALTHPLYGETRRARMPVLRARQLLLEQVDRTRATGARRREDALRTAAWQLAASGTAEPASLIQAAAIARYAHDYPQALALLEALPEAEHTIATRLMQGEVLYELGRPDDAEEVLQRADALAATEPEVLAVTAARSFSLFWGAGRTADALAANDAARTRVTSQQGLQMLRYSEGSFRIASGEPARGLDLLGDLTDDIRDDPNPEAWLAGAMMKPVGLQMTGRTGEAVTFAEHAHESHRAVADRALYTHPAAQLISVAYALGDFGRLTEADEAGERGYEELTAASILMPTLWIATVLGKLQLLSGHPATARRWFAEVVNRAHVHHNTRALNPALSGLAVCAAILGDVEAADHALREASTHPPLGIFVDLEYQAQAWLAAARGDLAHARELLTNGASAARAAGQIPPETALLTDAARLGGARQVTARLAELAQVCDGVLIPARAHLAAALAADDPGPLMDAARELEMIGAHLMAAEAATAAAGAYQRVGQTSRAAGAVQTADACAARCEGARTPLLSAARGTAHLTARERDIALLAARGTPSKDIADALHLSVRTVDNHLQHAYTKLGVTTRRELAKALETTPTPTGA